MGVWGLPVLIQRRSADNAVQTAKRLLHVCASSHGVETLPAFCAFKNYCGTRRLRMEDDGARRLRRGLSDEKGVTCKIDSRMRIQYSGMRGSTAYNTDNHPSLAISPSHKSQEFSKNVGTESFDITSCCTSVKTRVVEILYIDTEQLTSRARVDPGRNGGQEGEGSRLSVAGSARMGPRRSGPRSPRALLHHQQWLFRLFSPDVSTSLRRTTMFAKLVERLRIAREDYDRNGPKTKAQGPKTKFCLKLDDDDRRVLYKARRAGEDIGALVVLPVLAQRRSACMACWCRGRSCRDGSC